MKNVEQETTKCWIFGIPTDPTQYYYCDINKVKTDVIKYMNVEPLDSNKLDFFEWAKAKEIKKVYYIDKITAKKVRQYQVVVQEWLDAMETQLAEDLDKYTNPDSPEYDLAFHEELFRTRPDWFKD